MKIRIRTHSGILVAKLSGYPAEKLVSTVMKHEVSTVPAKKDDVKIIQIDEDLKFAVSEDVVIFLLKDFNIIIY